MPEKYQEEIEEILKRVEEVSPRNKPDEPERTVRDVTHLLQDSYRPRRTGFRPSQRWPSVTPGKIMLVGIIVLLLSAMLGPNWLVWVGVGMLVMAYLLFFITPRSMSYEKRWRSQALDDRLSPWERFKRWLKS